MNPADAPGFQCTLAVLFRINDSSRHVQKEENIYFFTFQSERDLFYTDTSITDQTFIYI